MKTIALPYWGQIIGLVSQANPSKDSRSLFITRQQSLVAKTPSLYILDNKADQFSLSSVTLPCVMQAIIKVADDATNCIDDNKIIIMLGHDGHLYQTDWQAKKVKQISTLSLLTLAADLGAKLDNSYAVAIAALDNALVILYPNQLIVWPYTSHKAGIDISSSIAIEPCPASYATDAPDAAISNNRATTLATSSDGKWLVVGDKLGYISSYQWSDDDSLSLSSHHQSHQGAVSALIFEPIGQHFFSAGTDKKLYRTHVQGDLHPVDRAKASQHSQKITALCISDSRLFTAADDKIIKSWAFDKGQPNTCKEDLTKTRLLELSSYAEHSALIAIGNDQSLRFIPIGDPQLANTTDNDYKLQAVTYIIKDGYQRIHDLLTDYSNNSDEAFKEGLLLLQSQADDQTLEVVNRLLSSTKNKTATNTRELTAEQVLQLTHWVATTHFAKTTQVLEQQLNSPRSSKIRLAAFQALANKSSTDTSPLHYLEQAIKSAYEEIVASAIQGYLKVAINDPKTQRRILPILQNALSHKMLRIRKQALAALEAVLPDDSPRADLIALDCSYPDVIQAGLIRLYQRGMLDSLEIARQLLLLKSHHNPEVRQTAFYISIQAHPKLVEALKQQAHLLGDTQLIRTLNDFDDFRLLRGTLLDSADDSRSDKGNRAKDNNKGVNSDQVVDLSLSTQDFVSQNSSLKKKSALQTIKQSIKSSGQQIRLRDESLEPLLQSLANTYGDISFRAAYALACLQDKRAFGALIRLMHADDTDSATTDSANSAVIRAGVASALGHLNMEDGKAVLPVLLDDKDAGVRMVAMKSLGKLADNALSWAAVGFASTFQDIHEQSLAIFLTQALTNNKTDSGIASRAVAPSEQMMDVLLQALNNPFTSIRLEVVKVLLNRQIEQPTGTNIVSTIALLQQSLFEDVHQVAIEEWQRSLLNKTSIPEAIHQAVLALLFADSFTTVRQQAFTIAVKNAKRLDFIDIISSALFSPYADIKQLALTTLQAKASIHQLESLLPALVGMLADDSIELRGQALKVALALTDLQPIRLALATIDKNSSASNNNNEVLISAALASPYPDIQLNVAQLLASQSSQSNNNNERDNQAYAIFEHYLTIAMPTQDKSSDAFSQWHQHVSQALSGLATLSNPAKYNALEWYTNYLHHPDADFSQLAPKLMWIISLDSKDTDQNQLLVQWQKDERPIISQSASLALAVWGDEHGQHFFTQTAKVATQPFSHLVKPLTPLHWLQAQQGLGIAHARQLRALFDSESYAPAARLLLIFNDIQRHSNDYSGGNSGAVTTRPQQLIEALSFADNETAVVYANILARYPAKHTQNSLDDIWQYLSDYLSRKVGSILSAHTSVFDSLTHSAQDDNKDSVRATILQAVSPVILQKLAALSSSSSAKNNIQPLMRAKAIGVISHLSELLKHDRYDNDDEVLVTLQSWQRSLYALLNTNKGITDPKLLNERYDNDDSVVNHDMAYPYQNLAFGAWLGVIREGDDYYSDTHTTDQAIRGLRWLAMQPPQPKPSDNDWQSSVSLVLLPLLNHNNFSTRELAWNSLHQLDGNTKKLADYALSTPHQDMIKRGLHLLLDTIEASNSSSANGSEQGLTAIDNNANKQLIALLKTNNQRLAEQTYILLKQRLGLLPASLLALDSYCRPLAYQVIGEWQQVVVAPLTSSQTKSLSSQKLAENQLRQDKLTFLRQAILHEDWRIRYQAFSQLINAYEVLFADNHLFDALFEFWRDSQSWSDEKQAFSLIISALQSYRRANNADNHKSTNAFNHSFDHKAARVIVDNTYEKLLDLIDYPQRKMPKLEVYQGIASLRDTQVVAALLQRLRQSFEHLPNHNGSQNKSERQQIFDTLVTISGYDQPIEDYLDEAEDKRWLQRQYPRHPQVLLTLFTTLIEYGDYEHASQLLASLSWANTPVKSSTQTGAINKNSDDPIDEDSNLFLRIDSALALAYEQLPTKYTFELVQTLAYRAERRTASLASLQKALTNKDANVQILAAESLAKCGQAQGLTILMATVDYNTDGELRRRSVLAIGELMGSRSQKNRVENNNADVNTLYKAYDKLIKLAEDEEHYLQDVASEALGRLAQSGDFEYSRHIFELLKSRLLDPNLEPYNPAIEHWLNGLRWLNTLAAWEQIRLYIHRNLRENEFFIPEHAITLLPFNDSDANKALLLELLQRDDIASDIVDFAYPAAQKLWGNQVDTIYPYDWATLQNNNAYFLEDTDYLSLKRILNHATIDELTTFISQHGESLSSDILTSLQNAIMTRTNMSKPQLVSLINSSNRRSQLIGLHYLAQYPADYLDNELSATLQNRFYHAKEEWQTLIDTIERSPINVGSEQWLASVEQTATIINQVLWLACRYLPITKDTVSLKQMVESVTGYLSGTKSQTGLKHIIDWLDALRQRPVVDAILPLATAINGYWQQLLMAILARPTAEDSLLLDLLPLFSAVANAQSQPLSYDNQKLLTSLLSRLKRCAKPSDATNEPANISTHQQLLLWVKTQDASALYHCAINEHSDISMQIRAIEALGQLHEPKIEQWLKSLMNNADEDMQKLAYKVLRRWQRAMVRAQQKRPSVFTSMDIKSSLAIAESSQQSAGDNK